MGTDGRGDKLWTVVTAHQLRHSARQQQVGSDVDDPIGGDRPVYFQDQAFPGVFSRDRQPLQGPSIGSPVVDEIPAPNVVLVFRTTADATVVAVTEMPLFPRLFGDFQPLTNPQAIDSLEVHTPPFLSQFRR